MIDSDWLLESARQTNPEPGRPKQTMLRRGISNLYYALFHELCRQAANLHIGSSVAAQKSERYVLFYRSLEHARLKKVFESVTRDRNVTPIALRLAKIFVELQDTRHRADYDPRVRYSKAEVRALLSDVEWALGASRGRFPEKDLILTKLVAKDRA